MTNREAIEVIKLAQAEVEWEYPMDYAAAFDMAISALQAQEAKRSTYEQGEKMNRQRKVVITVTYNDLGVIVDTKAEELDSSAQPNLRPTCNQLVTDTISRTAAIALADNLKRDLPNNEWIAYTTMAHNEAIWEYQTALSMLPSAQPEPSIPISWIEKQIDWLKSMDNGFSNLNAMNISVLVKKWRKENGKDE